MSKNWTDNQRLAIDARGCQILVSAAAGSGKTAVLTERVKNILSDPDNRVLVSDILVVTFTKAAAGEMKDRISAALKAELDTARDKAYIKRQLSLLPTADICTIDSFCAKLVRENFHAAGVSPDFRVLDENDNLSLLNETAEEIIGGLYEENSAGFNALNSLFLTDRDDSRLSEVIISLYNFSRSYPSAEVWLDTLKARFSPDNKIGDTSWADVIFDYVKSAADYYIKAFGSIVFDMERDGGFNPDCIAAFENTAGNLADIFISAEKRDWDEFLGLIMSAPVVSYRFYTRNVDENIKERARFLLSACKKTFDDIARSALPTSDEHIDDMTLLYPAVSKLVEAVKLFSSKLLEKKTELDSFSFDDVLHKCIDLLVEFNGDSYKRTPLSEELSKKYAEILIDEYQDTNEAQNIIFSSISRDKTNLYCVGDVKQSIYRFRLASPELFTELRSLLPDYNGEKKPSQITLEKNFRSRKGVTDAVNFVFSKLMTARVGDIDYNEREYLYCGAKYDEHSAPDTELHLLDVRKRSSREVTQLEARHIAEFINEEIRKKTPVKDGETTRPVRYGDFCILLRSAKNKAKAYADALAEKSVPNSFVKDGDVGFSKEIMLLISILKATANPLNGIELAAVMLSPLFGFTPDELAEIRMLDKKADLYVNVLKCVSNNKKCADLISELNVFRNISLSYSIYEFMKFVVERTSVDTIYASAGNGAERTQNIKSLINFAKSFTDNDRRGLGSFIKYLDKAVENGALKSSGCPENGDNSVKIMTVHKSKGLEFPFVILADCSKSFNVSDSHNALTVSREAGIGLKVRNDKQFTRYNSLSSASSEKAIIHGEISEELRVLYVAMTRAKERLIFTCPVLYDTVLQRVQNAPLIESDGKITIHPFSVLTASGMGEWLLYAFSVHPDCGCLRELCGSKIVSGEKLADFGVTCTYDDLRVSEEDECAEAELEAPADADSKIIAEIESKNSYCYPYEELNSVLAKRTASSYESKSGIRSFFAVSKPKFISGELSGALKGTAVHKFLELCDFKAASISILSEADRLLSFGSLSEDELSVLDECAIKSFFDSDVGKRLLKSDRIEKEYEFSVLRNASELYEGLSNAAASEQIVVEGKLDCAFFEADGAVLIDYKTDNVTDESAYISAYSPQLRIYKSALAECENVTVKEVYIYSFRLKKFISITEV